jgi:hypothetical protein
MMMTKMMTQTAWSPWDGVDEGIQLNAPRRGPHDA